MICRPFSVRMLSGWNCTPQMGSSRHAHDLPLGGLSGDLEAGGQRVALDDERVIARGVEGIGHPGEEVFAIVLNGRGLPVHHPVVHDDFAAERVSDALMAEADAEERELRAERADDVVGQPGFAGRAGAGRDEDALGPHVADLVERDLVVAHDAQVRLQLAEILDEVEGERVVVVYDEDHLRARTLAAGPGFGNFNSRGHAGNALAVRRNAPRIS